MGIDLDIDTVALRASAARIAEAAAECGAHHPRELPALQEAALGDTVLAHETELLVRRRVEQAFELVDGLSAAAEELAARVLAIADLFDHADALHAGGE